MISLVFGRETRCNMHAINPEGGNFPLSCAVNFTGHSGLPRIPYFWPTWSVFDNAFNFLILFTRIDDHKNLDLGTMIGIENTDEEWRVGKELHERADEKLCSCGSAHALNVTVLRKRDPSSRLLS